MGVGKPKSRLSEFVARACRLPRDVAGKVGNLSDSLTKERLRAIQGQNHIPFKFLTVSIILLLYLPWMISLTYIIPPQIAVTFGSEVSSESYCSVISSPEVGVDHAVLLNTTPFSFNGDWELDPYRFWNEYDFNRYGWNDSDGYHFTSSSDDYDSIVIERIMQIPIANYSELTVSAEFEGVSGATGIYLQVYTDENSAIKEDLILPGNMTTVTVTAPLSIASLTSDSWLSTIVCRLQIGFAGESQSHIKLRSIVIDAEFTGKLSRVQIDFKSTDNSSLYDNSYMKFADYSPRLAIVQNNYSDSISTYFPNRVDDEIYLPPGTYEGATYWYLETYDLPHPNNSSTWAPNVKFVVTEDTALKIDVGLFAKRFDIDVSPPVILRSFSLFFVNNYQYSESTDIVGSTLNSNVPGYLYIPGEIESLSIRMSTWSSMRPRRGYGWSPIQHFEINQDITCSFEDNSRNVQLSVNLPLVTIGGALFGLGEIVVLAVVVLLVIGFIISMRRTLRYSGLRNRISDSRILPILMLSASIFLPWSMQLAQYANYCVESISSISWFSMPFMIRWSDNTAIQLLLSVEDWWYVTWIFILFFFIPLSYAYLSLSSIETEEFNRTFALALFLPYFVVLSGFNFSVITLKTIALGPIVALAAFPVWLLRLGLRKLGATS